MAQAGRNCVFFRGSLIIIPNLFPNSRKSVAKKSASPIVFIFVPLPQGMSITKLVAPTAFSWTLLMVKVKDQ
jgi:hypothetical protein